MPEREWREGFIDMWPTTFVQRRLDGHVEQNRALIELTNSLERANKDLTTDYLEPDLFNMDHPAVNWLREHINATIIDYFKHLGLDYPVNWSIQGWANINRFGDYHDPHNHPHSYLSGTYYVRVPKDRAELHSRKDVRPGCITFYDPRPGINMGAIAKDPYVDPEYTVAPEPGMMMMWPAFLSHFIHPNLSKKPRVSISFNIVLKWSDSYLPRQD